MVLEHLVTTPDENVNPLGGSLGIAVMESQPVSLTFGFLISGRSIVLDTSARNFAPGR
jgi:hypothetical protein